MDTWKLGEIKLRTSFISSSNAFCRVISRKRSRRCSVNCSNRRAALSTSPKIAVTSLSRWETWRLEYSLAALVLWWFVLDLSLLEIHLARLCKRVNVIWPFRLRHCNSESINARLNARCCEYSCRLDGIPKLSVKRISFITDTKSWPTDTHWFRSSSNVTKNSRHSDWLCTCDPLHIFGAHSGGM